jgi:hypothetical protein
MCPGGYSVVESSKHRSVEEFCRACFFFFFPTVGEFVSFLVNLYLGEI